MLGALSDTPENLSDASPYFLGSIVLIKAEALPDATVVDGQQRLTTLTLLLSAIRSTVQDPAVQAGITKRIYEQGDVVSAAQAHYRLSLRERDCKFFREYVQHERGLEALLAIKTPLPDAQSRLKANAQVFMDRLSELDSSTLLRLVQFIITRCFLVTVATPDLDSAYRIFGVMNSRGLDLSATDILKAEIIGGIPEALREDYTQRWEDEEEALGRDAFGELFSHIRMVYRKAKSKGTLLKEFKEHVGPMKQSQAFIDELLIPMAEAFSALNQANYASIQHAEAINGHLRWLNRLEFKDWMPPALAFYVRHRNAPEAMLNFYRDLERLAYSMLVRKSGINERIERFSALTAAVEKAVDLSAEASPLQLTPLEQQATYEALEGPMYATHSPRALSVLLLRLDHLLSCGTASYQHDIVTVEHILPQQPAPNSKWREWVSDVSVHQHWVHRLGNLTLLSRKKNSAASNYDFERKKTAYFTKNGVSSFAMTTQVLTHAVWNVEVMEERQQEMLAALESHWRLEERCTQQALDADMLSVLNSLSGMPSFELESAKHGLSAIAQPQGSEFIVRAGSQAKLEWTGAAHGYQSLRTTLLQEGALVMAEDGSHLKFAKDVAFSSPSAASAIVLARPDNGRTSWRIKGTTIPYAAWYDNLPEPESASEHAEA